MTNTNPIPAPNGIRNLPNADALMDASGDPLGLLTNADMQAALTAKQDVLVSGTNIKTVNGSSLLGSGDLMVASSASARVVYASASIGFGNATLEMGSSTFGTDFTTQLQALLDLAATAPIHIICDGAYSATQLRFRSNTRWTNLPGCGVIQRNSQNRPLLINYNPSRSTITEQNIIIEGGIFNGNKAGQGFWWANGYASPLNVTPYSILALFGAQDFVIRNVIFRSVSTFCVHFGLVKRFTFDSNDIDVDVSSPQISQDGIHINGPASEFVISNNRFTTYDDAIALNADDGKTGNPAGEGDILGPHVGRGAITDAQIIDNKFRSCLYAYSLYSTVSLIDRIRIAGSRGSVKNYIGIIANRADGASTGGVFGRIVVSDTDVSMGPGINPIPFGDAAKAGWNIGAAAEQLVFDSNARNDLADTHPYFLIQARSNIKSLVISGIDSDDTNAAATGHVVSVASGATINKFLVNGVCWNQSYSGANKLVSNSGTIDWLHVSNYLGPLPIRLGTAAGAETGDAFALASTWTLGSGYTEITSDGLNCTVPNNTTAFSAFKTENDTFSGNVNVSCLATVTGTQGATNQPIVFGRCTNTPGVWSTITTYYVALNVGTSAPGIRLYKAVSGTHTAIGSNVNPGGLAINTQYKITLNCNGSTISCKLQRVSDSNFLTSGGTWQVSDATCSSVTDLSIAAASAKAGVASYQGTSGPVIQFRTFALAAAV